MNLLGMVKCKDDSGQIKYFRANHLTTISITPIPQIYNDIQGYPQYTCTLNIVILYNTPMEFNFLYKNAKTAEKIADKLIKIGNKSELS